MTMLSTTLSSTILKTKKRLSNEAWYLSLIVLLVVGLVSILGYGMRINSVAWVYNQVEVKIPVMHQALNDPVSMPVSDKKARSISKTTPVIVMTEQAFYLGDTTSFTGGFQQLRNKIKVPHRDGSPQIGELLRLMKKWKRQRLVEFHIQDSPILILVPSEYLPVAVLVQVIQLLKDYRAAEHIVLGSHFEGVG